MLLRLLQLTKVKNDLIGLDIGSDFIKILQINNKSNPKKIEKFAIKPLPAGAVVKNEIKQPTVIAEILKATLEQAGITTKNMALAISRSSTIIKNITVDSRLSTDELESRAWIEAMQQFPDLVGESYLDFSILGESPKDPGQLELILVACRKDVIDSYVSLLNLAGTAPKMVDVNSFAFERALAEIAATLPESKNVALLNLDSSLSTLVVLSEKKLIYAHDERFDATRLLNQFTEAGNDSEKQQTVLKENLSAHLRHTMHFFYSTRSHVNIDKLFIGGDCATKINLIDFIHNETGLDTEIINPFVSMKMGSDVNESELKKSSSGLVLCAGLALSKEADSL